jgi:hypothetical protein
MFKLRWWSFVKQRMIKPACEDRHLLPTPFDLDIPYFSLSLCLAFAGNNSGSPFLNEPEAMGGVVDVDWLAPFVNTAASTPGPTRVCSLGNGSYHAFSRKFLCVPQA